jgi:hypothetical protein
MAVLPAARCCRNQAARPMSIRGRAGTRPRPLRKKRRFAAMTDAGWTVRLRHIDWAKAGLMIKGSPAHRSQAVSRRIAATMSFSGPAKESLIADLPRKRSKSAPGVVPTPVASSSLAQKSAESSLNREIST